MRKKLSHLDRHGNVRMVDVGAKQVTRRMATARGRLFMSPSTLERLVTGTTPKGNALTTAHLAGVMAAKRASEIIPLAHPLPIEGIDLTFAPDGASSSMGIEATVRCRGRTGVEMEALTAVSAAALTLYDMLKAIDRDMVIGEIALWEKRGGRSGTYRRRT